VEIAGRPISLAQLNAIAFGGEPIELTDEARARIHKSREIIEEILERGDVIYGISTGFGKLSDVKIEPEALRELQLNLVRSHCCGIGEPLAIAEVRAMIFLRANVLALGFSGVRLEVVELLCQMLNRGVYPVIPEQGSVGASGDLAPLAHLALGMVGEGESFFGNERVASADALSRARLKPIVLEAGSRCRRRHDPRGFDGNAPCIRFADSKSATSSGANRSCRTLTCVDSKKRNSRIAS
jgi:histidine ammonia-lyase